MIVTVALLRAALTAIFAHDLFACLPVMVSSPVDLWARPLATTIRFGHLQTVESDDHVCPVGRLTRNPSDGPAVAALTRNPSDDVTARDIHKAPTVAQLATSLTYAELLDPNLPVVIPTDGLGDDTMYAPLDPVMDHRYYDPDGEHHYGVWGHDLTDGEAVHVLWPIHPRRAAEPPVPIRPMDWLARLHQTQTWHDPYGRDQPITSLDLYDTCMALAWLDVNAATITNDLIRHILGDPAAALTSDPNRPAPLQEADLAVPDPRAWISATPLAQALTRHAS
ncbi:hypothetical protein GCM10010404_80790 [Nonomuraea africana]|uniref:Uncharacterized protein n=1 Tax=Nonomuraea africana TaxID=46171 RepID=A0ABR9KWX9_9ACTN|nr:hypothetical protein [Nonomuraea africana]MBE1566543.1 hypothetical protein [Nonomuraea africana]